MAVAAADTHVELPAPPPSSPLERAGAVALGLLGLVLLFHPMVLGGFRKLPGDLGDARLVHYFLEHSWLWLRQQAPHRTYWDPPVFHPEPNVMAYSETLLSSAPVYWLGRLLPVGAAGAYQLWLLAWSAASFAGAVWLFRRVGGIALLPAAVGAFVFAYGGARAVHITHAQLLPQLFSLVVAGALVRLLASPAPQPRAALLAGLAAAAQLWTSFYLGFFLFLATVAVLACALLRRETRGVVTATARRNWQGLFAGAAAATVVLAPLAVHYGRAAATLPPRVFDHTYRMIPTWDSWLRMGPASWWYAWLERPPFAGSLTGVPIGAGWITTAAAVTGLWLARRRPWVGVVLAATALLFVLTLRMGPPTPWRLVTWIVPGASAARAVFRIAIVLLLPIGLGVALLVQRLRHAWAAALLAAVVCLEQGTNPPSFEVAEATSRARWVAERVPRGCEVFFFVPRKEAGAPAYPSLFYHVDAMMGQLERGVPTVNGYSGGSPVGYPLYDIVVSAPAHSVDVHHRLAQWIGRTGLDRDAVCVVEEDVPFL